MPEYCIVLGWKTKKELNGVEERIKESDQPELTKLSKKNLIGSCSLSDDASFQADPDEMTFPENARQCKQLTASTRRFEACSPHSANNLSWELQQIVCKAIASIDGGLLEEPQMGEFKSVSAKKS